MTGGDKFLMQLFTGADTRFVIPVYQRNYDWKRDQCKQLFDDLIEMVTKNVKTHFFGSIVSVQQEVRGHMLIIDGQQRITTVSLLLLALYKFVKSQPESSSTRCVDKIYGEYLTDSYSLNHQYKLLSVKDDRAAYEKLFDDERNYVESSNMTKNFRFFYDEIQKCTVTPEQLFNAVNNLQVIDISLGKYDENPQKIFESLNSTGLDLTEADKIRNFLLMSIASAPKQGKYYNKYWQPIEQLTKPQVDSFLRDYLTIQLENIPVISQLYFSFKRFFQSKLDSGNSVESLLDEILEYARIYNQIHNATTSSEKVNIVLRRLNRMEMGTVNPFLMQLASLYIGERVTESSFVEILKTIETFLFRRLVCGVPTNSLSKIFTVLHRDAMKMGQISEYEEIIKYLLLSKSLNSRFPKDEEFEQAVKTRDFYSFQSKNRRYLFDRLETGESMESVPGSIAQKMEKGDLSVEHIMPQRLTQEWKSQLGDKFQVIHEQWLNRIANLTITGYNLKYSNKPFLEKKNMDDGFTVSPLFLNRFVAQCDQWGETELQARQDLLVSSFLKLWPLPQSQFVPPTKTTETYSLDSDEDFYTGQDICAFSFCGERKEVSQWSDMFREVLKSLQAMDFTVLKGIITATSDPLKTYFFSESRCSKDFEISQGIYVNMGTSTKTKIWILKHLFPLYGLDGSEIQIELTE